MARTEPIERRWQHSYNALGTVSGSEVERGLVTMDVPFLDWATTIRYFDQYRRRQGRPPATDTTPGGRGGAEDSDVGDAPTGRGGGGRPPKRYVEPVRRIRLDETLVKREMRANCMVPIFNDILIGVGLMHGGANIASSSSSTLTQMDRTLIYACRWWMGI